MKTGHLLIALAALNAILYSMLLPLWEGFDEPFHFRYVQGLANQQGFPDARSARLSREVRDSILLAPASQSVKNNLPQVTTYAQFFSWSPERRAAARRGLYNIPRDYRWQSSDFLNYEAQHAPLEYALLAIPERILAGLPLPSRVLLLRILTALSCSFLLYAGASALCIEVGVRENHRNIALFSIFSSQMTWATLAHIANDSLAVPLTVWLLVFLIRCTSRMDARNVAITAVVLSAGLLTKAYFVALAPLLFGICLIRRDWRRFMMAALIVAVCAGPWYARNYRLYGVVMGTQDARGGIGLLAGLGPANLPGMSRAAVDGRLRLYPNPMADKLREKLAQLHGCAPENILVGNGSDEVLAFVFAALLKHDKPLLFPDVTYSFYPAYCRLFGVRYETVPLDESMRVRVDDFRRPAGAIILPNPNAPTGIALPRAEIARLVADHPDQPVVIDEAYVDFGAETAIPLVASHPNLLVVQTMSKSRALAGLPGVISGLPIIRLAVSNSGHARFRESD